MDTVEGHAFVNQEVGGSFSFYVCGVGAVSLEAFEEKLHPKIGESSVTGASVFHLARRRAVDGPKKRNLIIKSVDC